MRAAAVVTFAALLAAGLGGCKSENSSSGPPDRIRDWAKEERFADNERAVAGARIFAQHGCLNCHTYLESGTRNVGAPDLTRIGGTGRTEAVFASYLADPAKYGDEVMPPFESLGRPNLLLLGAFLEASKGPR